MYVFWCCVLSQMLSVIVCTVIMEERVFVTDAEAVVGEDAKLPCDLSVPISQDRVSLVIWYKEGEKSPIYSLDVRERSFQEGTHWYNDRHLGGRAYYTAEPPFSFLVLESVREQDTGTYKCRVDFKLSPTKNSLVNLTVVVPCKKLVLLDSTGETIDSSTVGPVREGASVQISCVSIGGFPLPRVSWWSDGIMVDDTDEIISDSKVKNVFTLDNISRRHLNSKIECRATNTRLLTPLVMQLAIEVLLGPLEVEILGENLPLSAGKEYEMTCQSSGSRPPATITWWKGGKLLHYSTTVIASHGGNQSTSTISIPITKSDEGVILSCRSDNPLVPASALEDSLSLNVYYSPTASVRMGSNINASNIREGMDVYFECNVNANPRIRKLVWMHNGQTVSNNASSGTIISNQTLVLQSISRKSSGYYSCYTTNSEGSGESNHLHLDVKFEPHCKTNQQRVYGAARMEEIGITCHVEANPAASLFQWSFNNSAVRSREVERFESKSDNGSIVVKYMPVSDRDYGTLLCWGSNDIGSQSTPCIFHIVPAGKPDTPHNCSVVNKGLTWLNLSCSRGFDGGLPQEFIVELRQGDVLVKNITSTTLPEFNVRDLEPGQSYNVTVYSSNGKGRSLSASSLTTNTLDFKQTQTFRRVTGSSFTDIDPAILSGIVASVALVLVCLTVGVVLHLQRRNAQHDTTIQRKKSPQILSVTLSNSIIEDDRNPDVVPHTNEVDGVETETNTDDKKTFRVWETSEATTLLPFHIQRYVEGWDGTPWQGGSSSQLIQIPHKHAETQTLLQAAMNRHKESAV